MKLYRFVYGALGFSGVYFIVCAFAVPLLADTTGGAAAGFGLVLVLMLAGYALQAVFCALRGFPKPESDRSYEGESKYYDFKKAVPVLIPAAGAAILASRLTRMYLAWQGGGYYDTDSVLPLLAAALTVAVMMLGSFVWFAPYDRLVTGRACVAGLVLTMSALMLFGVMGTAAATVDGLCLMGYGLCAVIATNQHAISKTYHGTVVSFLTPRARGYNLVLALCLTAAFFLILLFAYIIVSGFRTLGLMLMASLLSSSNTPEGGYSKEEEAELYSRLNQYIYGNQEPVKSSQYWCFILFIVVVVIGGAYVLTRRTEAIRGLIRRLKDWIIALFDMIFRPIADFVSTSDDIFCNYVDEEEKLQDAQIREWNKKAERKRSYRDFQAELRTRRTEEEKYRYAYATYVSLLRSYSHSFRASDTPRETAARLRSRRPDDDGMSEKERNELIDRVTGEFERIEFREDTGAASDALPLSELCRLIRKYY